jgi:hypothetical protein
MGTKSIQVPEEFHAYIKAHKRDDETMGEALIRLAGGPHPSAVAGLLADDTADAMLETIAARGETAAKGRTEAADSVGSADDS